MSATVFYTDMTASWKKSVGLKVLELFDKLQPAEVLARNELVAVKLHFGESGNAGYLRPQYVRKVIDRLAQLGTRPFLTDTNTLYVGSRSQAHSHLLTAFDNGFTREVTGAPLVIADGLRGNNAVAVPAAGRHVGEAHIAADIVNADALVVLSHFKGHELAGFGGSLKNVGMGCASRQGKLEQHSNISPAVIRKKCIGCGDCIPWCQGEAISLEGEGKERKSVIDPERCVGCAECIITCPQGAIRIQWNESVPVFMEKMVEYASAVLEKKRSKAMFLTFITDVSPLCDCTPFSDRAIVPDVGILASLDPVAIDQAAVDLVNNAPGNPLSCLTSALEAGGDKFRALYPQIDWSHQLSYAASLGLGTREYTLVELT